MSKSNLAFPNKITEIRISQKYFKIQLTYCCCKWSAYHLISLGELIGKKSFLVFKIPGGKFLRHFRRMFFTDIAKRISNRLSEIFAVF